MSLPDLSTFLRIETQVLVQLGNKINMGEEFTLGVFFWNTNSDGLIFRNAIATFEASPFVELKSPNTRSLGDIAWGYVQIAVVYRAKQALENILPIPFVGGLPEPLGKITVEADVEWNINSKITKIAQPIVQIVK